MPAYLMARVHVMDPVRCAESVEVTPGIIEKIGPPANPVNQPNQQH